MAQGDPPDTREVQPVGERPVDPVRCPHCGGNQSVSNNQVGEVACEHVGRPPVLVTPPLACQAQSCWVLFFPDGRFLARSGSRSSMVQGWWQVVLIKADDLEQAELGPDGWLCLALLEGDDERFLSVAPQHLPRMARVLANHLKEDGEIVQAATNGEAGPILTLVQKAFASRVVTGRDTFDEMLKTAEVPFERFSWP